MISKVYTEGLRSESIKGYVRVWLKEYGYEDKSNYILYGKSLYIFKDNYLITTFPLPNREAVKNRFFIRRLHNV